MTKREIRRFAELEKTLKSKFTIFLLIFGTLILLDYLSGNHLGMLIIQWQFDLRGGTPNKIFTIFGTFTNVLDLTRGFEFCMIVLCYGLIALSCFKAILGGLRMKI